MDKSISSRTRSSLTSDSINNWKICDDNFKVPQRTVSKISTPSKYKKEIISIINDEIDVSKKKYETSIHELNYLQRGNIFVYYKPLEIQGNIKLDMEHVQRESEYEISKKYFIDESDDSEPEYIEGDEIINRVIAERVILNRVEELKKNNLWSSKMIAKKPDPQSPTFHWNLLLKEMSWLQGNMSTAKQTKRIDAKKLAVSAYKYVKDKEAQMAKNHKEETIRAKKHCMNVSKMVKEWWKQMQKIVDAKQKFRLDAKRQEAINDHLGKVIETTQKYTEWLTEDLNVTGENETSTDDDPEFQMKDEHLQISDDEETIAKDESEMDYNAAEEIEALNKQNEMSLEDILNELPDDYFKSAVIEVNNNHEIQCKDTYLDNMKMDNDKSYDMSPSVDKEILIEIGTKLDNKATTTNDIDVDITMFDEADESSEDFEDTMVEQEKHEADEIELGNRMEIDDLKNDAEIPIEELLKMYKALYSNTTSTEKENNCDNVEENDFSSNLSESDSASDSGDSDHTASSYESSDDSYVDLGEVFNIDKNDINDQITPEFKGQFLEISEVAMSTQPRGFTLESTDVKVQVPFLLKYSLREYQHVGLDWMAAIYEKRLNGVLADEMGLGKTIQTIALLAYLSCEKGIWGPHLVVVPTSVVLNWEIEFKKWCPGFKILTYFGSLKERKEKRKGWTKTNAFHVCITSYKLAIQDSQAFKRKKWKYIILDEAQNIKNFKSQRWQTLLTFNSQRRLLLTGTPLQNNLMELWSLMHFLMPNIFQSHREFNEWFGSPLSGMIEGSNEYNEQLVMRLHKVLRPFILRRLKRDVEKQMPQKYEHLVLCSLSKRQRFLYDDYMSLASTKEMLSSGQFMSIINILMQLRKVCNHPNLFEDRPTVSPFSMIQDPIDYNYPRMLLIDDIYEYRHSNGRSVLPAGTNGLAELSSNLPKFVSERILGLTVRPNLIQEVDNIYVTDWVLKFSEKFNDSPQTTSFIPRDLIDYLSKTENIDQANVSLPNPLYYGLKIRKGFITVKENSLLPQNIINSRRQKRYERLHTIAKRNVIRCSQLITIGTDVIDAVSVVKRRISNSNWEDNSVDILKPRTLEKFIKDNNDIVDRVTFVIPAVLSRGIRMNTSARPLLSYKTKSECLYNKSTSNIPICLSRIRQNQLVQFPDTRLIEYDCGKLQILVTLLKRLKSEGHRCLIFTQMTRMLDVLEQFLSYHGYRYLRLDGTTKIEQRQIMMEQFNKDDRIFVFILSTRSGGVGVNLTGADTVIFYDSDWNPTMDAQAQDRCHRIGQTRDVHIYRLISRMTIEENILKKANEKRCLNEMAIEGGQFNMSYFKTNTLQDIFQTPTGVENSILVDDQSNVIKTYKTSRGRTIHWKGEKSIFNTRTSVESQEATENKLIDSTQLEAALEEVEDENDRLAAKITRAEARADLVEFDETVPWDETEEGSIKVENDENRFRLEMESQLQNFNAQLNPLQKYGVGWIEQSFENVLCFQLEFEETQIENNKQTWELDQIKALHEDQEEIKNIEEDDMLYIYGSYDPYAAQKEELEKLRREEEQQQLQALRKEKEVEKREKDKAAAQAWAQKQHRNAIKRRSDTSDENDTTDDSGLRSLKQRKIVIPRMEFPDETITTVNTINTSSIDDMDAPLASSSSCSTNIDNRPFPVRRGKGRPAWKNITNPSFNRSFTSANSNSPKKIKRFTSNIWNANDTDYVPGSIRTTPTKPFRRHSEFYSVTSIDGETNENNTMKPFPQPRRIGRPPWKNIPQNNNGFGYNPNSPSESSGKQFSEIFSKDDRPIDNQIDMEAPIRKSFPQPKRLGRPSSKDIPLNYINEYDNSANDRMAFPPRRYNKLTKRNFGMNNELSRRISKISRKNFPSRNPSNQSPDENIAPYSNENFHSSSPYYQKVKSFENIPKRNGFHKKSDDFVGDIASVVNESQTSNCDLSLKKKRGRPALINVKKKNVLLNEGAPRHRNNSESTSTSAILNKKNSFKIPVKTLNGDHKLFSAPLLLLKTKPVFVVTRKIEDQNGNVYTQNLTYPINCNESFNAIAAKLSSFASTSTEK